MKANPSTPHPDAGYALLMVLIFCSIGAFILAATMTRTGNVSKLNERNTAFTVNISAAEAATEKITASMLQDFRLGGSGRVNANLNTYRTTIPTASESSFWTNFSFSDGMGGAAKSYVQCISNFTYVPMDSQYYGLWGYAAKYRVLSNARNNTGTESVTSAVQQDIQLAQIPIFQFAIFYNSPLEFTWAAPFTIRGRVHANADVITGSTQPLIFNSIVTTTGGIYKKAWAGYALNQMTGAITYNGGTSTNVPTLSLPVGTNNSSAAVREIVNFPPATESMTTPMGTNRYYNKAEMTILVSNTTVTVSVRKQGGYDDEPTTVGSWWTTNAGYVTNIPNFISISNTFTDQREGSKTVKATQLDLGKFKTWAANNPTVTNKLGLSGASAVPNILYVADFRTNSSTTLTAIRLTNGVALPSRGLSIATPNPMYVWGNYNCPDSSDLNTTDTTLTAPASLISDAMTVLSSSWRDSASASTFGSGVRVAANTTVNAAMISGIVFSDNTDGSPFSGGVMNYPRLLEDWGNGTSTKLTLNTSMVNLYNSVYATNVWQTPGTYYYAPVRDFNFDNNFTNMAKIPPGTPCLSVIIRNSWANPPSNTTNYAGY